MAVVICLKNRTFAVYKTTPPSGNLICLVLWFAWKIVPLRYTKQRRSESEVSPAKLWFAWKIVPLRYTKQPFLPCALAGYRCDLLEKSYLCGIQNNAIGLMMMRLPVVICLKNRTFAVYKTTVLARFLHSSKLWFAWKIVRFFKQITTSVKGISSPRGLFCIPQRYDFSSKSQLSLQYRRDFYGCFVYRKGTIFQANHNIARR